MSGGTTGPAGQGREPLFELGRCTATPGAQRALNEAEGGPDFGVLPAELLLRHVRGEWGDVDAEEAAANERAVHAGERIVSAYTLPGGARVWVVTEADRSRTTFLLPEEV